VIRRIGIVFVVFVALTATVMAARAQVPGRTYRLAVLATDAFQPGFPVPPATLKELARLGFIEGSDLKIEPHFGPPERLLDLAHELVLTRPDVILAGGTLATSAARAYRHPEGCSDRGRGWC
jgi:hypothetical protein